MSETFEVESDLISEDSPNTAIIVKAYEALYLHQTGEIETLYFNGERLIDAAAKASERVSDDPFNCLISVRELGPIN